MGSAQTWFCVYWASLLHRWTISSAWPKAELFIILDQAHDYTGVTYGYHAIFFLFFLDCITHLKGLRITSPSQIRSGMLSEAYCFSHRHAYFSEKNMTWKNATIIYIFRRFQHARLFDSRPIQIKQSNVSMTRLGCVSEQFRLCGIVWKLAPQISHIA